MNRLSIPGNLSSTSLTFGEVRISASDIKVLKSNDGWISSTVVAFYVEFLNSRMFTSYKSSLCVPPDTAALLQITPPKDFGVYLEPLDIVQKDLVLFPIYNNEGSDDQDLLHWSLVVFSKWDNQIVHYDSFSGHNANLAKSLGTKISSYFDVDGSETQEVQCLQQEKPQNSGLHMLAQAEAVITYGAKKRTIVGCPLVSKGEINNFRQKITKLITKLKQSSSVYEMRSRSQHRSVIAKSWHEQFNDITVCLGDSLLRRQDIELLHGPSWLNDTLIAFYFEYLESHLFKGNKSMLCVPPQVTQCVKMIAPDEIGAFLDPLKAQKKNLILFALNDHEFCEAAGGTHWSLLVFSKPDSKIYHFDSCRGLNRNQAVEFGQKLSSYFGKSYEGGVIEAHCLQQNNNYDCGVHVLCNAEHIIQFVERFRTVEGCPLLDSGIVGSFRRKMFEIILNIKATSGKH